MATLIRPKRWGLQKPAPGSQIDWGHPLAQGLVLCHLFNEGGGRPDDLVSASSSTQALGTWLGDSGYMGLYSEPAPRANAAVGGGVFTLLIDVIFRSLPNAYQDLLGCSSYTSESVNNGAQLLLRASASATKGLTFQVFSNDAAATYQAGREATPTTNKRFQYAGTRNAAGLSTLWRDAVQLGSASPAFTAPASSTGVGALDGTAVPSALSLFKALVYSRALSQADLQWLVAEPYAFIVPQAPRQRYWQLTVAAATGSASLTLTASGTAQAPATGAASLTLAATGTAQAPVTGAASLTLTAAGTAQAPVTGSASLSLAASGTAQAPVSGTGSLSLSASGTARAPVTGSGSLSLTAAGTAQAPVTGTGSLTLQASGTAQAPVSGTASLTLQGSLTIGASPASGTAALNLTAAGTAQAAVTGVASLSLTGSGTAQAAAAGVGSVTLAASGLARAAATGQAFLTLQAAGITQAPTGGLATLSLLATLTAQAQASAVATLELFAQGTAVVLVPITVPSDYVYQVPPAASVYAVVADGPQVFAVPADPTPEALTVAGVDATFAVPADTDRTLEVRR